MPFAVVHRMSCGFRRPFSSARLRVVAFMLSPAHYFHLYSCRLCKRVQDIRIILCWPKTILSCVFANKSFATSRFPCSRLLFLLLLLLAAYTIYIFISSFSHCYEFIRSPFCSLQFPLFICNVIFVLFSFSFSILHEIPYLFTFTLAA